MDVAFPLAVSSRGRTVPADRTSHVRQLIELTLFTSPGERVNRPDFGCGVLDLVFEQPNSTMVSATTALIRGSLQHWLADEIEIRTLDVGIDGATLHITVGYLDRRTRRAETFVLGYPS